MVYSYSNNPNTFYCQKLHEIQLWCLCKFSSIQRMKISCSERSWLTGIGNYTALLSLNIKTMLYYLKMTIVFTLSHSHKESVSSLGRWWWRNSAKFVGVEKILPLFVLVLKRVLFISDNRCSTESMNRIKDPKT